MRDLGSSLRNLYNSNTLPSRVLKAGLTFASCFYRLAIALRELAFVTGILHVYELPAPVISIGNVTVGGTGKTPTVVMIVQMLAEISDRTPVILSRGYGQDEIRLLSDLLPKVPHYVGKDRFQAGMKAIADLGENLVFVLDDGFQHRSLKRDLDIVLIDATEPFGLRHVLPRGFLREPLCYLHKAQAIAISRCDFIEKSQLRSLAQSISALAKNAVLLKFVHLPTRIRTLGQNTSLSPQSIERKSLLMFAAIGNPSSFHMLLTRLGANISAEKIFPDHYRYQQRDLEELCQEARNLGVDALVTTAKDAVKLSGFAPTVPVWILDIELDIIEGKRELTLAVQKALQKR